ncbi:MAG: replication-associated recombination protein A, partial [Myxococcota bacterium]
IDEIHRFSKSQQDALLPHVEAGTVILIGATTENPSFEVNAALLSRTRVLRLEPLSDDDLSALARRALRDRQRGLGELPLAVPEPVLARMVAEAGGDARRLLTGLEVAATLARGLAEAETRSADRPSAGADAAGDTPDPARGPWTVTEDIVREALQRRTLLYDKAGDEHFAQVSAFIKSMRGSDPDAAVYWMTRMLEAGEDPLFLMRRMVIFAAEDIGNADPRALTVATSATAAVRFVGLPEAGLIMTQAAVYLACAAKSNTALTTYAAARRAVREHGALPVPDKLRNAHTALDRGMGRSRGYRYPHDFAGHYVPETYLPEALVGTHLYQPSSSGDEAAIAERVADWRAQVERVHSGPGAPPGDLDED